MTGYNIPSVYNGQILYEIADLSGPQEKNENYLRAKSVRNHQTGFHLFNKKKQIDSFNQIEDKMTDSKYSNDHKDLTFISIRVVSPH